MRVRHSHRMRLLICTASVVALAAGAGAGLIPPQSPAARVPEPSQPPPRGEPTPIAGQGYRKVFEDDFKTFKKNVWRRGLWYEKKAPASDIYARNGILHIVTRRANGYPDRNVSTHLGANDSRTRSFRQGYFEARIKIPAGTGHHAAWWMMSDNWMSHRTCGSLVSEFDIFESMGGQTRAHSGALHRNTKHPGPCGAIPDQINTNGWTNDVGFDQSLGFHTYSGLWTQTEVTWYIDGRALGTWAVWDSTDQPMSLILSSCVNGGWGPAVDASTPDNLDVRVDWVRVWQKPSSAGVH
jgi:beta-glucanase (GH16 family)